MLESECTWTSVLCAICRADQRKTAGHPGRPRNVPLRALTLSALCRVQAVTVGLPALVAAIPAHTLSPWTACLVLCSRLRLFKSSSRAVQGSFGTLGRTEGEASGLWAPAWRVWLPAVVEPSRPGRP